MGALPDSLRPRLREDVRFVPYSDGGVYLHGDHGTCLLRGQYAYDWVSRLAPALDGSRTLAELTAPLPDDKRSMVDRLIRDLIAHRMVVDELAASPHELTEAELRAYDQEIAFIGYALDSPERRFQGVRHSQTVLIGEGRMVCALVAALLGSGWRDLQVITREAAVADVFARSRRDPDQRVRVTPTDSEPELSGEPDLVVQLADDPAELIDRCRRHRDSPTALAQVLLRPDEAWLAQVGPSARTGAESGWRRLGPAPSPSSDTEDHLTGPVPEVTAAMVALACFSHLTGLDARDQPDGSAPAPLTRVDLRNLDTRVHHLLRHPLAGSPRADPADRSDRDGADAVRATVAGLAAQAPLTADQVLENADSLVDARVGVVASLDEEALAQLPLSVCRATIRDPVTARPAWAPLPDMVGWGEDRHVARLRALLGALAGYACLATRTPADHGWGVEPPDRAARAVAPDPPRATRTGQPAFPTGVAAGLSWEQAVAAGLRAHCEQRLTDHEIAADGPTVPLPDTYLARLVRATGEPVEIRDLTGVLGVPAYAFWLAGEPAATSAAATAEVAMQDGLERLLLHWQSRTRRQSAYRRVRPRWYEPAPHAGPAGDPFGVRLMADALRRSGRTPVVVPLHGDPEVARLVPHLVEVALIRD